MDGLNDAFSGKHSGWHTEDLAGSHQITREQQDRWAERSQKRFSAAQAAGKFAAEITPIEISSRKGPARFEKDEHNRPDTTLESLSKLNPAFRKDGTITAGNAPGLNTGASAMVVADRGWADHKGLKPMARLAAYGIGAVERTCSVWARCPRSCRRSIVRDGRSQISSGSRSMKPSQPLQLRSQRTLVWALKSSTSKAAPSHTVIRSVRAERY
jgi:Thiolase, N-terminal domain